MTKEKVELLMNETNKMRELRKKDMVVINDLRKTSYALVEELKDTMPIAYIYGGESGAISFYQGIALLQVGIIQIERAADFARRSIKEADDIELMLLLEDVPDAVLEAETLSFKTLYESSSKSSDSLKSLFASIENSRRSIAMLRRLQNE